MTDITTNKLHLNNPPLEAEVDESATSGIIEQTESSADLLLMVDIESLALGPRPVITQIAMLAYELESDELLDDRFVQYLPIEPQQQIIPPRRISASTIAWWMKQSDEAREKFELNTGTDFEDLVAAIRGLIAAFNRLTHNGTRNYEISAKGPKFDIVAIETLIEELGLEVPWDYWRVTDVRQDLRRALIKDKSVPKPKGFVPHVAYWDSRWQIEMFLAARRLRNRA
jgi:hypothetical protein